MQNINTLREYPEIEGASLMPTVYGKTHGNGEKIWVLNGEPARNLVATRGVEIGASYRFVGNNENSENVPATFQVVGVSDDQHGFKEGSTKEDLSVLYGKRAMLWVRKIGEDGIGYLTYLKNISDTHDGKEGFTINSGGEVLEFQKVDSEGLAEKRTETLRGVINLLD